MTDKKMIDTHRIAFNSEISAFQEAIQQNNELLERLKDSRDAVESEALRIIDAMGFAFDQKNESISAMRNWRKTIVNEATQATNAVKALNKALSAERMDDLREFVEIIERLNKISPGILVGKLFSED